MKKSVAVFHNRGDQIAHYLRTQIRKGHWTDRLPPERLLAHELGVSRRSLRSALAKLTKEGLILDRSQAGTRLAKHRQSPKPTHSIGILFASHLQRDREHNTISGKPLQIFDEIRRIYAAQQIQLDLHSLAYLRGNRVSSHFKKLLLDSPHDCWILNAPTIAMQHWCHENKIPAIILGTVPESCKIPSVGSDHYALCRHAAGQILREGHQHIALILPSYPNNDDLQGCLGFTDMARSFPGFHGTIIQESHDQSIAGVCRLVNRLLKVTPFPTAWLVFRQGHFFTVFSHLLRLGIKIPEQVSLVCRDSDLYIGDLVPEPTRYQANTRITAHHGARLAIRLINGQCQPGERISTMPNFFPGQTLGRPPTG